MVNFSANGWVSSPQTGSKGQVRCKGKLLTTSCDGTCEGACELAAGATCTGECQGSCQLDGRQTCDGECLGDVNHEGSCVGECKLDAGAKCYGECKGSCKLSAGTKCDGICKGECTYDLGKATCAGELTCESAGDAPLACTGICQGDLVPPAVVAECEASVKAQTKFDATCAPPFLDVAYRLNDEWLGDVDAEDKLELEAQLHGFVTAFRRLQAAHAKLELVASAGAELLTSLDGAIQGTSDALVDGKEPLLKFSAVCAVAALPETKALLSDGAADLVASMQAAATVTSALGYK